MPSAPTRAARTSPPGRRPSGASSGLIRAFFGAVTQKCFLFRKNKMYSCICVCKNNIKISNKNGWCETYRNRAKPCAAEKKNKWSSLMLKEKSSALITITLSLLCCCKSVILDNRTERALIAQHVLVTSRSIFLTKKTHAQSTTEKSMKRRIHPTCYCAHQTNTDSLV